MNTPKPNWKEGREKRSNFAKVVKEGDTRSQSLRTNTLGKKLIAFEKQTRPACLKCNKPIDLRPSRVGFMVAGDKLPHGYLHPECEEKSTITAEQLEAKLEQYHNEITVAGLATEAA